MRQRPNITRIACISLALILPLAGLFAADPSDDFPTRKPSPSKPPVAKPLPEKPKPPKPSPRKSSDPSQDFPTKAPSNGKDRPKPPVVPDDPPAVLPDAEPEAPRTVQTVAVEEAPWTIADAMRAAHMDLFATDTQGRPRYSPELRTLVRYLDVGHYPPGNQEFGRGWWRKVLSGHCNERSRESEIVVPVSVAGGRLLRIVLDDYGWGGKDSPWEKLADFDPDYHVRAIAEEFEIVTRIEIRWWDLKKPWTDGKFYQKPFQYEHKVSEKRLRTKNATTLLTAFSPDLEPVKKELLDMVAAMQTQAPIIRGDWFLHISAIQADRNGVGYYDFIGTKALKDFEKLVGFNEKAALDSGRTEYLEAVANSEVSQQPRRIASWPAIGGMRFWQTFDSKEATEKFNPLRVLDRKSLKSDASEYLSALPNKLIGMFLADAQGNRQDSAPDFIGPDTSTHSNDGRIHVGMCMRCHTRKGDGFRPIDGWAENLFTPPPLKLTAIEYKTFKELRNQYSSELKYSLDDDRRVFARALHKATGMTPKEWGVAYGKAFAEYDSPVDLARAAKTIGTTPKKFQHSLNAYLRATGTIDTVLGIYVLPLDRQRPVPIKQFQEITSLAREIVRKYP